jgi:hypothetical protein
VVVMRTLTSDEVRQYEAQGYLLVSGLIPAEIAEAAEAAMWTALGAAPDDPDSWAGIPAKHGVFDPPALVACYTPSLIAAAARLAGEASSEFTPPSRAYAINVFPQEGEWEWPRPHIDHAIKEHGHKTFPRAFRIAVMTYLNAVPLHGAGTVVWPGSHRKLESLARSDPAHYALMWTLNQELKQIDLGDPVELTPQRGDVLFYHYLCAHAGSKNCSRIPRLALNMKWSTTT